METIILASSSPRRQELLKQAGIPFRAAPSRLNENLLIDEEPTLAAKRIAREKLDIFLANERSIGCHWALAADTFIRFEGKNYGKPQDQETAEAMLRLLSGKEHAVYTGMALYKRQNNQILEAVEMTKVEFMPLSDQDISWYLETGEWQDAAGGYKLQGKGQCIIKSITGSFSNVMGLPLHRLYSMLQELNYNIN